ncbi:MAG: branched-chain amino acid ABC transporter permease [Bacillota bacterium]|nr:branched-chain amino acid ABC transporter permease [Bacillota bacterium]
MSNIKKYYGIIIIIALLAMPFVINSYYWIRLLTTMGIYLIIAMGLNMLLGYTGLVSIGQAGIFGIAAYTAGLLMKNAGISFWVSFIIVLILGAFIGMFIGIITLKLKQAYLAIVTLGLALMTQTILLNWREVTGGFEGLLRVPKPTIFGFVIKAPSHVLFMVTVFCIITFFIIQNISKWGRSMRAVRDDDIAASMMGINVVKTKLLAFTLSAVLASVSGGLYAGLYGAMFPDYFSMDLSVLFLCMVVLGGMGTVIGPIIGALLITFGLEALRGLGEGQMLVYGIFIVAVCVLKPGGFVEVVGDIRNLFASKKRREAEENA